MFFEQGTFHDYRQHHSGWFHMYRFGKPTSILEVWIGNKYYIIGRGK